MTLKSLHQLSSTCISKKLNNAPVYSTPRSAIPPIAAQRWERNPESFIAVVVKVWNKGVCSSAPCVVNNLWKPQSSFCWSFPTTTKHFFESGWMEVWWFPSISYLVGWTNPFEKICNRQIGFIFPKVRDENTKYLKPSPSPVCPSIWTGGILGDYLKFAMKIRLN